MDSYLVSGKLSSTEGGGGESTATPLITYTDRFNEVFPYYLSIGMTEEQFWDKDCNLAIYYRKAEELRQKRRNEEMWLQGAYIYEAMCRVSPILRAFVKKGTKPAPYVEKPYSITEEQVKKDELDKDKKVFDKGKAIMEAFMVRHNEKFRKE